MIVVCREDGPVDVVDSPVVGRIGPIPFFRSSSHPAHGAPLHNMMVVNGPGIVPPRTLPQAARLEDVPATILALLGVDRPAGFDGVSRL